MVSPDGNLSGPEWSRGWSVSFPLGVHGHEWGQRRAVIFMDYHVPGILHIISFNSPIPSELNEELEFRKATWVEDQGCIIQGAWLPVVPNATEKMKHERMWACSTPLNYVYQHMFKIQGTQNPCFPSGCIWEGSFFLPSLSPAGSGVIPTRCPVRGGQSHVFPKGREGGRNSGLWLAFEKEWIPPKGQWRGGFSTQL